MNVRDLKGLLAIVKPSGRSTQPVQAGVLVEQDEWGVLRLRCSDLESVDAEVTEGGWDDRGGLVRRAVVPHKALVDALKGRKPGEGVRVQVLPGGVVAIEGVASGALIPPRNTATVRGFGAEDWEGIPDADGVELELGGGDLGELGWVARACSGDETRPTLTGVQVDAGQAGVLFVATDTHRLHLAKAICAGPERAVREILPEGFVGRVGAAIKTTWDKKGEPWGPFVRVVVQAGIAGRAARVNNQGVEVEAKVEAAGGRAMASGSASWGAWCVRTRTIEGQFPDWSRVVPDYAAGESSAVHLQAEDLAVGLQAVRGVAKGACDKAAFVVRRAGGGEPWRAVQEYADLELAIVADDGEGNQAQALVAVGEVDGAALVAMLGANVRYMADTLPAEGAVTIRLPAAEKGWCLNPWVIEHAGGRAVAVVMPMAVDKGEGVRAMAEAALAGEEVQAVVAVA